eukprot:5234222-Alexandrium_andersonii.AAC.1
MASLHRGRACAALPRCPICHAPSPPPEQIQLCIGNGAQRFLHAHLAGLTLPESLLGAVRQFQTRSGEARKCLHTLSTTTRHIA